MVSFVQALVLLLSVEVSAVRVSSSAGNSTLITGMTNQSRSLRGQEAAGGVTFQGWVGSHLTGRGIWKWSNSLDAYQRHFAPLAGRALSLCEVGVQSGGSIEMWKAVLGDKLHYYGIDINAGVQKFADASTTIVIGDQADINMWNTFYTNTAKTLDILVDDGGHQPHQMGLTLHTSFPHINPGGFIAIEDIHGRNYVQQFFWPAAQSIGAWNAQGQVESVHLYPFELIVKKAGAPPGTPAAVFPAPATIVNSFQQLWAVLPGYVGKWISVQNEAWGPFLGEQALRSIFAEMASMHDFAMVDTPPGCATTAAPVCTNTVRNSQGQMSLVGVHIFATNMLIEVAPSPPVIHATRRGTEWLPYGF